MFDEDGPLCLGMHQLGGAQYAKYFHRALEDYRRLLRRLHKNCDDCDLMTFYRVLESATERLYVWRKDNTLVATAQATLSLQYPVSQVIISNVITDEAYSGQGLGKKLLAYLETDVRRSWGWRNPSLRLFLTNAPSKNNAAFYEKCGFCARTPESGSPTVVWTKNL